MILESKYYWQIFTLFVLLTLSALFSASETALMSLSKINVQQMNDKKVKGIKRVNKLLSDPNKLLSSILIGNNLVNIGASSLMTSLAIDLFGNSGVGIATGVMTLLILIFAEITPKSLATQNADKLSVKLAPFVNLNMILVTPISFLLNKTTSVMVKALGGNLEANQPFITHEELRALVSVSHKEGILEGEEKDMIDNVFEFSDSYVYDIMVPRTEVLSISLDMSYADIIDLMSDKQHSRIPVYDGTMDNIIGVLYIKDLLFLQADKLVNFNLKEYLRQPHFTYMYKPIKDLFKEMKNNRIHMVVVIDEYGGTEGIITMEDLIEEIVGDIEDEYDKIIKQIDVIKDGEYIVSGNVKIEEITDLLGTDIESEDFDTIAGFVIGLIDRIPKIKEEIQYENIRFIVEKLDRNRVDKIRIIKEDKIKE